MGLWVPLTSTRSPSPPGWPQVSLQAELPPGPRGCKAAFRPLARLVGPRRPMRSCSRWRGPASAGRSLLPSQLVKLDGRSFSPLSPHERGALGASGAGRALGAVRVAAGRPAVSLPLPQTHPGRARDLAPRGPFVRPSVSFHGNQLLESAASLLMCSRLGRRASAWRVSTGMVTESGRASLYTQRQAPGAGPGLRTRPLGARPLPHPWGHPGAPGPLRAGPSFRLESLAWRSVI